VVLETVVTAQRVDVQIASFHLIGVAGSIRLKTGEAPDFIDITDQVAQMVADAHVTMGMAIVFTRHTTTALVLNENESGLRRDVAAFLERMAPKEIYYAHNDMGIRTENLVEDESPNGHSHAQNMVLGSTQLIPVLMGSMALGTWQRIFLIELDHPRDREVVVQVWGIGGGNGRHRE
jgi:secondary thiamine-phosphate synthase enzyme